MNHAFGISRMIVLGFALVLVGSGCGTHSRYNPDDKFGDVVNPDRSKLASNATSSAEGSSEEKKFEAWGKELFNNSDLGTNGQSCNSCHPGGGTTGGEARIPKKMGHGPYVLPIPSLVGAASRFPKYKVPNGQVITLQQMDNNCMRMFMAGKRMPLDAPESIALASYVTSLSNGEMIEVSGK